MHRRPTLRVTLLGLLALGLAVPLHADTISVAWDALNDPQVSGYRVYYGPASGNYTLTQDVGLTPQAVLSGLSSCTDYYVSVKAVASDDTESALFSNEVSGWPRPIVSTSTPQSLQQGTTQDVTINGANFRAGVVVTTSNPGVTVNGISIQGCNQLTANLSVASAAALGVFDLIVTDATGIVGTGVGVASVTSDTTAPAITNLQSGSIGSTTVTVSWTTDEPADGQVFYRETGETVYQQTALDGTLTTAHAIALPGLIPVTSYEYSVESTDGSGNSATQNGPSPFTTSSNPFTYLRFEPENRPLTSPAEALSGSGAFANAWLQLEQGTATGTPANPSGSWDYGFSIPSSATWYVWFRMYGLNDNANAWFETVDGASFAPVEPAANSAWEWVAARSWTLLGGHHTLTLGGAEALARIDRVLITDDPAFVPTEQPGTDVTPPNAPTAVTVNETDSEVVLGWTNPSNTDLDRIVLRFRTDGITPTSPIDGQGVIDRPAVSGAADGTTHSGLTNGVTISYAMFAIDTSGNASPAVAIEATPDIQQNPPPPQVQSLRRTDNQ